jgi:hypothetical protein
MSCRVVWISQSSLQQSAVFTRPLCSRVERKYSDEAAAAFTTITSLSLIMSIITTNNKEHYYYLPLPLLSNSTIFQKQIVTNISQKACNLQ